jgi:entericidin B
MVKALAAILGIAFVTMLAGCNTVEGVGKDIKATGTAVEKSAQKTKSSY